MNNLIEALNAGKRRGYEEIRKIDGGSFIFQYALKKQKNVYHTYFFSIEESKIDMIEDNENEELKTFENLDSALTYLTNKGAEIEKLSTIKNNLPF
ncbi:hypothetical protein [Pseudomonas sp. RGB]|uniref:hypothetical protein n=1 Tax=unclassified Pseudomonas TaxID=196821 RepID=UPI00119338C8|nr:hypothetical protein [Pseudomonas sp. RGB]TVT93320.1 hypothetical protein FPT15_02475 [Pseudomonas sp. RGB]